MSLLSSNMQNYWHHLLILCQNSSVSVGVGGVTGPDGVTLPSPTPSSILNNTAPALGVRIRIVTGTGEDISGTKLGEKLFLRIEIDQASIYGIFAKNLRAISPADNDEIELLDSRGCPAPPGPARPREDSQQSGPPGLI